MSKRTRSARRLASALTSTSGALVKIYYDRDIRRHRVVWTNGPDVAQMYTLAMRHAGTFPELDLASLEWSRGTNASVTRARGTSLGIS